MKIISRSVIALVFLIVCAAPLLAQNPNVAVRVYPDNKCVKIHLKNLRPAALGVSYVELWIFDDTTCRRICATRKVINKSIKACDTMDLDICCPNLPSASRYIYYVRVHHSAGTNEEWAFAP